MLPGTFAVGTCFLDVFQFCHTGNIVSSSKICFCFTTETFLLIETMLPVWQNRETSRKPWCVHSKCFWQHVFSFCQGLINAGFHKMCVATIKTKWHNIHFTKKPKQAFLCSDTEQDQWSQITWNTVHQRNQWIHYVQGFAVFFDATWFRYVSS